MKKIILAGCMFVLVGCSNSNNKSTESSLSGSFSVKMSVSSNNQLEQKTKKESNYVGSEDKIYGKLITEDKVQKAKNLFSDDLDNIYTVTEEGIFQVLIQLSFPLSINLDKAHLTDLVYDFMEDDSVLERTLSESEFIYYSKSIDKEYHVSYSLDMEGNVLAIYVTKNIDF